jgi:SAM-dependent methyltransferase
MTGRPWYKDWFNSPFYHKLYFERDEKEARDFISKLVDHLRPPASSLMFDVACGRGRHSRMLAEKGFFVTGIDLSPSSINFAKKFEQPHLEFYQHDMRLPFRVNYFDYAFNFFTSFGYFPTRREHDDAMRTIASSLKPGGIFVIDYLNVHYVEDRIVYHEEKTIGDTHYSIHRWHDETHFFKKITVNDPSLLEPEEHTEKVTKLNLGDFTDMLSYQQMQVHEVFGNFQLDNYDTRKTPRLIVLAKK